MNVDGREIKPRGSLAKNGTKDAGSAPSPRSPQKRVKNKSASPGRDARGRLLPGHTANPGGRPKGRSLTKWIDVVLDEGTNREDLARMIVRKAKRGEYRFVKLVLHQLDGRPVQALDVATHDIDPDWAFE